MFLLDLLLAAVIVLPLQTVPTVAMVLGQLVDIRVATLPEDFGCVAYAEDRYFEG